MTLEAHRALEGELRTFNHLVDGAQLRIVRADVVFHMAVDGDGRLSWTVHDLRTNQQLSSGMLHLPPCIVDLPARTSS